MTRLTISLDPTLEEMLESLRKKLLQRSGKSFSKSELINIVILGGIVGAQSMDLRSWTTIESFIRGRKFELDERSIDDYTSIIEIGQLI